MATTLRTLRAEVARTVGGYAAGLTSTFGSQTLLIDTRNAGPVDPTMTLNQQYTGWYAFLPNGPTATGTLPAELARRLSTNPAGRSIVVAPGFSIAVPSGTEFELFGALPPQDAHGRVGYQTCINRALRKLWREWWSFLSLVPDHDMEASDTTDWTASGATLSKVTTSGLVTSGKRALSVTTTGTSGYAASAALAVLPGERYVVAVRARAADADTTTLSLIVHDGSSGTTVQSARGKAGGVTRGIGWRWLAGEYTVPEGVYSVTVRLQADVSSGTTTVYFDDLIVLRQGDSRLPLPEWVTEPARQIVDVYAVNVTSVPLDGSFQVRQEANARWEWFGHETLGDAAQQAWLLLDPTPSLGRVPVIHALRTYEELSGEYDTTEANKDLVVLLAKIEALQALIDLAQGQDSSLYAAKKRDAEDELRQRFPRYNPNPARRGPQLSRRF